MKVLIAGQKLVTEILLMNRTIEVMHEVLTLLGGLHFGKAVER